MVRNGDADILSVEDPLVGALETKLVFPIPDTTSRVRRLGQV